MSDDKMKLELEIELSKDDIEECDAVFIEAFSKQYGINEDILVAVYNLGFAAAARSTQAVLEALETGDFSQIIDDDVDPDSIS